MITVTTLDFAQNAVGTQQSQRTTDAGRTATLLLVRGSGREQDCSQVTIAQSADGEFATIDGLEESPIPRRPGIEGAEPSAFALDRAAELVGQLTQRPFLINRGESHKIAFIGGFGDLGSTA